MQDFEKIAQYDNGKGLTFEETILEAQKRRLRIANNLEISHRLVGSSIWESEKEMYPCRTGTLMAYEKYGDTIGKTIDWQGYTVNVPKQFQGRKNLALVCNHTDFSFNPKTKEISSSKFVGLQLPYEDGWYDPEPRFGIPMGEKKDYTDHRRYLYRYQDSAYLGFLVRGLDFDGLGRRYVLAYGRPYVFRFGVFGVKGNAPKVPQHKHEFVCKTCGAEKVGKR